MFQTSRRTAGSCPTAAPCITAYSAAPTHRGSRPNALRVWMLAALLCALAVFAPGAQAAYLAGVTATTTIATLVGNVANTVNGSGLSSASLSATHDAGNANNAWLTNAASGTVTFALHQSASVAGFSFWNQTGPTYGSQFGINGVTVQYSTDGTNFTTVPGAPTSFTQTSGNAPYAPQVISFTPVTATHIRFVVLSNFGGPPYCGFSEVAFNATTPPVLSRIDAQRGPVGSFVTLSGSGFSGATAVSFNAVNAPGFVVNSPTRITVQVPVGASSGAVQVTTPDGTATSGSFTVTLPGNVTAWGINDYGETAVPAGLSGVVAVAGGDAHSVALKSDGSVVAWGYNGYGETDVPAGLSGVVAIATGRYHSVALKSDGSVVAWGSNASGETDVPVGLGNVVAVAAGYYHSMALKSDGTVVAWGYNRHSETDVPAGLSNVVAIAGGGDHSLAVKSDGSVIAWGYNGSGQTDVPAGLSGVVAVAGGGDHSLALKSGGTVVAWGFNGNGETDVPAGLSGVVAIAGGSLHSVALKNDGTVVAWGYNGDGETAVPAGLSDVVAVAAGYRHSLAITPVPNPVLSRIDAQRGPVGSFVTLTGSGLSGATAVSFNGVNAPGFVVNSATRITVRVPVGASSGAVQVTTPGGTATSGSFTVTPPGNVTAWGANDYGQTAVPAGLSDVVAVAGGYQHSVALKSDGSVVAWGNNDYGQKDVPAGLGGVVAVAAGESHSVALKGDGTVVAWGYNNAGQTSVPPGLSDVVAVAAGGAYSVALKSDGTVVAWGLNHRGQTDVPPGLSNVVAVASGALHSLALKSDGTVVAWGGNSDGQTSVPPGLSDVVAVAGGEAHSVALKNDGSVVAWGYNYSGSTDVPDGLSTVVAISAGGYHSLALKSDGTVVAWGYPNNGQTAVPAGLSDVVAIDGGELHSLALTENHAPVAQDQSVTVTQDTAKTITLGATDADTGNILSYSIVGQPTHGTLGTVTGNQVTYTPADGSLDPDSFTFKANDGADDSNTATVSITLTPLPRRVDAQRGPVGSFVTLTANGLSDATAVSFNGVNAPGFVVNSSTRITVQVPVGASSGAVQVAKPGGPITVGNFTVTLPGKVTAWGYNDSGQTSVPAGLSGVVAVAGGGSHSVALKSDGSVVVWGNNDYGQKDVPPGLSNVVAVAAGEYHSVALKSDGKVVAWGNNSYGQTDVPPGLSGVVAVAAGGRHSLALKSDGTVIAWGDNGQGQTAVPAGLNNVVAVASGALHSLALKNDGSVVAWGYNGDGETSVPAGLSGVLAVAAGYYHNLALKSDGKVVAWGDNYYGATDVPAGLSDAVAVAAGNSHSVALQNDGKIAAWGYNDDGETDVPAGLSDVVAVAAGGSHNLALTENHAPVAQNQSVSTNQDTAKTITLSATDADTGNILSYSIVDQPTHGTLGTLTGNLVTYTPDAGYIGAASFTFKANDGTTDSNTATVSIKVLDTVKPISASVTVPSNGAVIRTLPEVRAVAADNAGGSGITRVFLALRRLNSSRVYEYWANRNNVWGWSTTAGYVAMAHGTTDWYVTDDDPAGSQLPSGSNLTNGTYYSYVVAYDGDNNTITSNSAYNFKVNTTGPAEVRVTTPVDQSSLKTLATLKATVSGNDIDTVAFSLRRKGAGDVDEYWGLRNGAWGWDAAAATIPATYASGTTWQVTNNLPSGSDLVDGPYRVSATATDKAGNGLTSAVNSFLVDNTSPASASVTVPANGAVVRTLPEVRAVAADNAGGSGIARVFLALRRLNSNRVYEYWANRNNVWSWSTTAAYVAMAHGTSDWYVTTNDPAGSQLPSGSNLADGTYYSYVVAYDKTGNTVTSNSAYNFKVDASGPSDVRVTTPADQSGVRTLLVIRATASDNTGGIGIDTVDITLRRKGVGNVDEYWANRGGTWGWSAAAATFPASYASGTTWQVTNNLPAGDDLVDGPYRVSATATDKVGNAATSAVNSFVVDNASPISASVTVPANGAVVNALPQVRAVAEDNAGGSGIARVFLALRRINSNHAYEYWANRNNVWSWETTEGYLAMAHGTTDWYVTNGNPGGTQLPSGRDLWDGPYYCYVVAYDKTNHTVVSSISSFRVKTTTTAPPPPGVQPIGTEPDNGSSITLSSSEANASAGTVTLHFTGPLDAVVAGVVSHYAVTVNGAAVVVESASYRAAANSVTLALEEDALQSGDVAVVSYDVVDTKGKVVQGGARIAVR